MKRVVVDASVAVQWLVPRPDSPAARRVLEAPDVVLYAPDFISLEVADSLWKYVFAGMTASRVHKRFRDFRLAPVKPVPSVPLTERALEIALALGHPVYDCLYVATAEAKDGVLVTADSELCENTRGTEFEPLVVWFEEWGRLPKDESVEMVKRMQEETKGRAFSDSTKGIREDRDER